MCVCRSASNKICLWKQLAYKYLHRCQLLLGYNYALNLLVGNSMLYAVRSSFEATAVRPLWRAVKINNRASWQIDTETEQWAEIKRKHRVMHASSLPINYSAGGDRHIGFFWQWDGRIEYRVISGRYVIVPQSKRSLFGCQKPPALRSLHYLMLAVNFLFRHRSNDQRAQRQMLTSLHYFGPAASSVRRGVM